MYATPAKRMMRVTLDVMCYDDLDLESLNWSKLLDLEGVNFFVFLDIARYQDLRLGCY